MGLSQGTQTLAFRDSLGWARARLAPGGCCVNILSGPLPA
jgi:hypothetical protein